MKRIALLFLLSLALVIRNNAETFYLTRDAYFREGAGTKFKVLGTIKKDANVNVVGFAGDWCKVKYPMDIAI